MIFSNGLDDKVRDGTKTQTRRLVKEGGAYAGFMINHEIIGVYDRYNRAKWVVGKTYAIQPKRGVKGDGRFHITKIRKERVQDITQEDIEAEGFSTREELIELWNRIHTKKNQWVCNPLVWVLDMEHVGSS